MKYFFEHQLFARYLLGELSGHVLLVRQSCVCAQSLGNIRLFVTLWTVAH